MSEFDCLEQHVVATRRSFQRKLNITIRPKSDTIKDLFKKFRRTGKVKDERAGNVGRPRTAITEGNVQQVFQPRLWVSFALPFRRDSLGFHSAAAVRIKPTSTHRLMLQSLHLYPYKIQTR